MTRNDKEKSKSKQNAKRDNSRVDALYRLADQACAGHDASDPTTHQKRAWAEKRLSYLTETNAGALGPVSLESPHAWIDHVLSDVSIYARKEKLLAVCECVELVQFRVRELLNSAR